MHLLRKITQGIMRRDVTASRCNHGMGWRWNKLSLQQEVSLRLPPALVQRLPVHRSLLGHKEEMLLSSLDCLECNNWNVYCVCLCNTLVVQYMCCCYTIFTLCFLLDRPVVCLHNESTILLAGPAEVGHWFAHDDLWGQLSPEAHTHTHTYTHIHTHTHTTPHTHTHTHTHRLVHV